MASIGFEVLTQHLKASRQQMLGKREIRRRHASSAIRVLKWRKSGETYGSIPLNSPDAISDEKYSQSTTQQTSS